MAALQQSDYRIRKLIGILGVAMPFALPLSAGDLLASISHHYYLALPSLIFIIILSTLGLFLISYKGYQKDGTGPKELLSDDWITNIGGIAVLIVVLVPTSCLASDNMLIDTICQANIKLMEEGKPANFPLLGHNDTFKNGVHLISAGVFMLAMGWMSAFKFTRGTDRTGKEHRFYRRCGYLVWAAVGVLMLYFVLGKIFPNFPEYTYIVYAMETVAIVPFGASWLVKGRTMTFIKSLMS